MRDYDQEYEEKDRGGFRVAAGVLDFFGVVLGAAMILLLLAIMISLFTWLRQDLTDTFASIGENFNEAVFVDGTREEAGEDETQALPAIEGQQADPLEPAQPQQPDGQQPIDLQPIG